MTEHTPMNEEQPPTTSDTGMERSTIHSAVSEFAIRAASAASVTVPLGFATAYYIATRPEDTLSIFTGIGFTGMTFGIAHYNTIMAVCAQNQPES